MENIISEEQFQIELNQLAEKNWIVNSLLKECGTFNKLPVNR